VTDEGRRGVVLDIETAQDDYAHTLSRRRGGAPRGSPIHEVVNASVLSFLEHADGSIDGFQLCSWNQPEYGEADILAAVDDALVGVTRDGGRVVTFNGTGHDLPTLRMRQLRWWLCDANGVERVQSGEADHMDIMLAMSGGGEGRWPTLADACASVGFSLMGPYGASRESPIPRVVEKCEIDVIGSAILMHYVLAARSRSRDPLQRGLPAFGRFVRSVATTRPHLERFALSRLLADDAMAWGAGAR
jgi:Predicted 3'-5' exonuclease related to the exonuclease domain of PolB